MGTKNARKILLHFVQIETQLNAHSDSSQATNKLIHMAFQFDEKWMDGVSTQRSVGNLAVGGN